MLIRFPGARRRLLAAAGVAALTVLAAGCAAQAQVAPVAPIGAAALDTAAVDLVTGSGGWEERRYRVEAADVELTRRCVAAAGLTWRGAATPVNPEAKVGGGAGLDLIHEHGYGLSDPPPAAARPGPVADDSALRRVLSGDPGDLADFRSPFGGVYRYSRGGCSARAHIEIYGDLESWMRISYLPQELNRRLDTAARADPRFAAKLRDWRSCMAAKGYPDRTPDDVVARLHVAYRGDTRPLAERRAAEVSIAEDDVSCDKRVGLSRTRLELRRAGALALPVADRAEVVRLAASFAAAERRAAATESAK